MTRWFEDIAVGEPYPLGSHTFTEAEIVRFGRLYDPQYFHTDPAMAAHSHFGGLVASGWHTVVVGHRKMVDALDAEGARITAEGGTPGVSGPSPGVNVMEFKAPVRAGDTVTYTLVVASKRQSNSLPGWGLLINHIHAVNQHGAEVYRAEVAGFSKLRDYVMPLHLRLLAPLTRLPILQNVLRKRS